MEFKTREIAASPWNLLRHRVHDAGTLVKFKLSLTVVYSAVMAYLIAAKGGVDLAAVGVLALGGFCVTGAANALNQVLERDFDKLMKRTADRPVAAGRMSVSTAVMTAGLLSMAGLILLALFNPWASFFGVMALLSYAFLYTPMKRISPSAIAIGAFPGALPVLIGCVAFQGELTSLGFALFAIQFFWQFPHFGAISWLGFEDYQKAGFKFVVAKNGDVGLQGMVYALCLVPVSLVPFYTGLTGIVSAIVLVTAALVYAGFSWKLYQRNDRKSAMQLMFSSFFYLPIVLTALWLDKI